MNALDVILASLMVVYLVWVDRSALDRFVSALLLTSACVSHDLPVLGGSLAVIAIIAFVVGAVFSHRKPSEAEPATPPGPRMSAHELMGLYEDIAKADRLRATGSLVDNRRASELMEMAIDQAAGPRRGL